MSKVKRPAAGSAAKKAVSKKSSSKKTAAKKPVTKKSPVKKSAPTKSGATKKTVAPKKKTLKASISALVIKALEDSKGNHIVELDVRKLTDIADSLVIVSGTSNRHVKSLADNTIVALKKAGYKVYGIEGQDAGEWVLVDFGDVILHVMQPHIREFYDLEHLWGTPTSTKQ